MPTKDECVEHAYGASTWLGCPILVGKDGLNPVNDIAFDFCPMCGKKLKEVT